MRDVSLWRGVLGVEKTVIERVEYDQDAQTVVAHVRPTSRQRGRCGLCRRRCPGYDAGGGRRRWRTLDLGTTVTMLEADAPRVSCPEHGVVVAHVPWARHGAGHTLLFDDQVAWLAVQCSKTAVTQLMRTAWRTVGAIITRVQTEIDSRVDRLADLRRIGIDEISYKKGHRYLTVVVNHDTGRLVWAAAGRDAATVQAFFDELGPERAAQITHVSSDAARWITRMVTRNCPNAIQCADPFHVVAWATAALDAVRRQAWNNAKGRRRTDPQTGKTAVATGHAAAIMSTRYALWKNADNLTSHQHHQIAWIAKTDPALHRAWLLKEGLRHVFAVKGQAGREALDAWLSWARRSRLPAFVELARKITRYRPSIDAALIHGLSNALIESTNTKIRLLTRIAFGFHGAEPLIALAMLALGGHRPALPGRS